jgi:hypothetical protein
MNLHRYRAPDWSENWASISREYAQIETQFERDAAATPPDSLELVVLQETLSDIKALQAIPSHARGLVMLERKTGFFSLFFLALSYIAIAEKRGWAFRVHYGPDFLYADPSKPEANHWDLFFQPLRVDPAVSSHQSPFETGLPSRDKLDAACDRGELLQGSLWITRRNPALVTSPGRIDENNRAYFAGLTTRYLSPAPHIASTVDAFVREQFSGHRVVGVHARGNEHDGELGYFRLARLPIEVFFRETDRELARQKADRVFLATDQRNILEAFRAYYGDRLVSFDAQRCDPGQSLHYTSGGPRVGFEVFCECLLLSRCDFLLHGISNVPAAACVFNPALAHASIYDRHRFRSRMNFEYKRLRQGCLQRLRLIKLHADRLLGRSAGK